jgi:hypothetical protein
MALVVRTAVGAVEAIMAEAQEYVMPAVAVEVITFYLQQ